jgi:beta-mannosidase
VTKTQSDVETVLTARRLRPLATGWALARTAPETCATPAALSRTPCTWRPAEVPGTVAASVRAELDANENFDADDWWYRTTFARPTEGGRHFLRFEGLATIAEVWLNGKPILTSRNMFRAHRVDVTRLLRDDNDLAIAFRSLDAALAGRRPRPRWKTRLVENQALRWARTTLLGRIPAWTPAITPVGPWGPIALESSVGVDVANVALHASATQGTGQVRFSADIAATEGRTLQAARLRVGEATCELALDGTSARGELSVPAAPLWWPHTHGEPQLVACHLELEVDGELLSLDCGRIGFREIALDTAESRVRFRVNGVEVFCRGSVWTPPDIVRLRATPEALRSALTAVRDTGANMLRVCGTMVYESDEFYALCDELGILVWQDFMFANMDYPAGDTQFRSEVEAEARHQVTRLASHPCMAAWCGGSEVAQQAAMMGLPAEAWCGELFAQLLPAIVAERHPGTPWFPSSPWDGALPMHVGSGIAHYYGVGAYRRPLADVKTARVKFATECLGLSNLPDGTPSHPPHHPRWKARVPRDNGAGYDFEDVRDFYLRELFGCDAVELRAVDLERYYAASRVASGEVMLRTFAEWRAPTSGCGGALVWFHRDLWPGAGWGIVDADGAPKSPYWYLKRAWAPIALAVTDEGLDGLAIHVLNDTACTLEATVEIEMLLDARPTGTRAHAPVRVAPRGATTLAADALLGHFTDSTHAYRFGPAKQDVVAARLRDAATGTVLAEDFHFPVGHDLPRVQGARIESAARWEHANPVVTIASDRFLQAVAVECAGFVPSDNYFHVVPGQPKDIAFIPTGRSRIPFEARFAPLNSAAAFTATAARSAADQRDAA